METDAPTGAITTADAPTKGTIDEGLDLAEQPEEEAAIEQGKDLKGKSTQALDEERSPTRLTEYVVLVADSETVPGRTVWAEVTTLAAKNQIEAKKNAVAGSDVLAGLAREQGASLIAIPVASFKPQTIRVQVSESLGFDD